MERGGRGTTGSGMGDTMAIVGRDTIVDIIGAVMGVGTLTTRTTRRVGGTVAGGMGVVVGTVASTSAVTRSAATKSAVMKIAVTRSAVMMKEVMVDTTSIVSSHMRAARVGRDRTCGKAMGSKMSAFGWV